ncbi:MAG: peptidoglycan editing factor PgeF [Polyangiaceae bacterium]|nr:peptidoglycan editing factor PgeF [Polyangiaceae bacterium]
MRETSNDADLSHRNSEQPKPLTLTSALLKEAGFAHGFFTRRGGVSAPPFDELNFFAGAGDNPNSVAINRQIAAQHLGVPQEALYYVSQVHGTDSVVLRSSDDFNDVVKKRGDITLSNNPGVACGVRSADCLPVLLADRRSGAVAAIHSGWKGTTLRVASIGVEKLRELIGNNGDIVAAIGPNISVCCFEVGDDVASELTSASGAGESALFWGAPSSRAIEKNPSVLRTRRIDLRLIVKTQLLESGVAAHNIDDVAGCTHCDATLYHSHRRDAERSGRLLSAIVVRS